MLFLYLLANLVGAALIGHTKKHSERFGCDSHIGQLNAPTSALSLSLICIQHSYVNHGPCFFFFFFFFSFNQCVFAHVFVCTFLMCTFSMYFPSTSSYSSYFFFFSSFSSAPFCSAASNKKRCREFWIRPFLHIITHMNDTPGPIWFPTRLAIKGKVRGSDTIIFAVALLGRDAPLTEEQREARRPQLFLQAA